MFHIRFTPYDISGYTFDFLNQFAGFIVAYEDKDKKGKAAQPHYHILVDTDYGPKTVRDAFVAACKIPKSTRGKNNAYYSMFSDWQQPDYICKYNDIREFKGFSEKEVLDYVISGKNKYLEKVEDVELRGKKAPATPPKLPFQQAVIADAAADWYNYKKSCQEANEHIEKTKVCEFVCKAMRQHGRGINQYLVKELGYAVLYDDLDYRDLILAKIKSQFNS